METNNLILPDHLKVIKPAVGHKKEPVFHEQIVGADVFMNGTPPQEPLEDYAEAYAIHLWTYVCVRAIATNLAAIEILPYVKKSDDSWEPDLKHEFVPLLKRPNAYMSGYSLREYLFAALKLTGNAYWYLERFAGRKVVEIWPLIPDAVKAVTSKTKMIDKYVYTVNGKSVDIAYENMIHFRAMNPSSFIYGQGAMAAARNTVATDLFAQVWNKNFFANSTRPDSVLETDQVLEDGTRRRIQESWKQMYQGPGGNGKTAILDANLKFREVSSSVKDMDFVNLRKELRNEILAAFGVPPSVVGVLEFANYSNMEQQMKAFWNHTLLPELRNVEETLTIRAQQITFTPDRLFEGDTDNVQALQPDLKLAAETFKLFVDSGIPPNDVIEKLDLPFDQFEGGDVSRQSNSGYVPGQVNPNTPPAPTTVPAGDPNAPVPPPAPTPPPAKGVKAVQLKDEDMRSAEWKLFDTTLRHREAQFESTMRGFFKAQRRRVLKRMEQHRTALMASKELTGETAEWLKRLRAAVGFGAQKNLRDVISVIFNEDEERALMLKPAKRLIKGTYFDFAVRMGRRVDPSFDFDLNDKFAEAWIEKQSFKLVREATAYTKETLDNEIVEAVQDAVSAGFDEGETIDQITDRINDVYDFAASTRAERIARTETASAANAGNQEAMKQTGVEKKEWLSSRDEKTRETHKEMDGQVVGISEDFVSPSGARLQFPGDPDAPAEERINCRCVPVPVVAD
jgi:HK97 family phage portal protein